MKIVLSVEVLVGIARAVAVGYLANRLGFEYADGLLIVVVVELVLLGMARR